MKSHVIGKKPEDRSPSYTVHTNIVEPVPYDMEELIQIQYGLQLAKQVKEQVLNEAKNPDDMEILEMDLSDIQAAQERTEKALSGCDYQVSGSQLRAMFPGVGVVE